MLNDLSHITKQIQRDTADADEARRKAADQRSMAAQKTSEGSSDASYYEIEAQRFDKKASNLEGEIRELTAERLRTEQRISELEKQRTQVTQEYNDQLLHLDNEITQLRGSGMLL